MSSLDRLGAAIEGNAAEFTAACQRDGIRALAFGVMLALVTLGLGILAFLAVFSILIEGFA